jgi:hypothetical protein
MANAKGQATQLGVAITMGEQADVFISYGHRDAEIATEIAARLEDRGIRCFVAERDISAGQKWEPRIRDEIKTARFVLILLTPRSRTSSWVTVEAGAAWVLEKEIIPLTMFLDPRELIEPIASYQARRVETSAQVTNLIQELLEKMQPLHAAASLPPRDLTATLQGEIFGDPRDWDRLQQIGEWQINDDARIIEGQGVNRYLLSHYSYGKRPIKINCRLSFSSLRPLNETAAVNAGIVFGWRSIGDVRRYYLVMFTGLKLCLVLVGAAGGPVFKDWRHIGKDVPFELQPEHDYNVGIDINGKQLNVIVDNHRFLSTSLPDDEGPEGRVGLRPWRCRLKSDHFEVREYA